MACAFVARFCILVGSSKRFPGGCCRFSFPKTLCMTLLNCITLPPQSDHLDKFPSVFDSPIWSLTPFGGKLCYN